MKEHGVPQSRPRCYIVGILRAADYAQPKMVLAWSHRQAFLGRDRHQSLRRERHGQEPPQRGVQVGLAGYVWASRIRQIRAQVTVGNRQPCARDGPGELATGEDVEVLSRVPLTQHFAHGHLSFQTAAESIAIFAMPRRRAGPYAAQRELQARGQAAPLHFIHGERLRRKFCRPWSGCARTSSRPTGLRRPSRATQTVHCMACIACLVSHSRIW
jgi:site-specific DNA-cytosine methylase